MRNRQILCPSCGTPLLVPPGCCDCYVRCGRCQHRFRLPSQIKVTDDAIASWLQTEEEEGQHAGESAEAASDAVTGRTAVLPAIREGVQLVRVDVRGALFEFAASRLLDETFRCAMPRRCLRCGARNHIRPHVIIYAPELMDSVSLEAEHSVGAVTLTEEEARDLQGERLLSRLPRVPTAPPPADQPMPYWLCDMCRGAGMISGQIRLDRESSEGTCRLRIRNLRRAEEFLVTVGMEGTNDYSELHRQVAALVDSPWDTLPEVVQHRLEQWFRPRSGERFVAYVPDRNLFRTEDGMAGLVISNTRLVYHTQIRHRETPVSQPLEVQISTLGGKGDCTLRTPAWEVRHISLDGDGIERLRRGLGAARFPVTWH